MPGINPEDIERWFIHPSPRNSSEAKIYEKIKAAAKEFTKVVYYNTPISADQTVAIRCIREAVQWAYVSVTCRKGNDENQQK